jgi:hypothetical protein
MHGFQNVFVDPNFQRLNEEIQSGKSGRTFDIAHFMRRLMVERRFHLYKVCQTSHVRCVVSEESRVRRARVHVCALAAVLGARLVSSSRVRLCQHVELWCLPVLLLEHPCAGVCKRGG